MTSSFCKQEETAMATQIKSDAIGRANGDLVELIGVVIRA